MRNLIKPCHLQPGDKIAVVTPSWGGPGTFPHRYQAGKEELRRRFQVDVVEMPHSLKPAEWIAKNPSARADDLMAAFSDANIKGIVASIGGDDSVRLLPYLDLKTIRDHPKIFMGYSDTTTLHFVCYTAGLTSFYGPSIMAGFAENTGMHDYTAQSVRSALFETRARGVALPASEWTVEFLDWADPANQNRKRAMRPNTGPKILQGQGIVTGHLLGGCIEVLEMIKGSSVWPDLNEWCGALLFLETSEEVPTVTDFKRWIRHYGTLGILQVINGILLGRPGGQIAEAQREQYDVVLRQVVRDELGLAHLPLMTQMDFGHTDPMMVLPYGVKAQIDCEQKSFAILEPGVE